MTPPEATILYLVRHGLTPHTGNRLSGWMEGVRLTEDGVAQTQAVAGRLADVGLDAVYSSPLDRTMETAAPIAEKHDLRVTARPALGEVRYGKWEGRPLKTLARTKLWAQVLRSPSSARFPEGESLLETQTRVLEEIERIHEAHPRERVCCVSHADVIKLVMAHYLGVHIDLFQRMSIDPASTSIVALSSGAPHILGLNLPAA